jgi:hypothetical protein
MRDVEQWKRPAGHLDLAREGFDAFFVRQNGNADFGKWWWSIPAFTAAEVTAIIAPRTPVVTPRAAEAAFATLATGCARTPALAFAARAAEASAITAGWARTAAIIAAFARRAFVAGEFGVAIGSSCVLGPGGKE